MGRTSREHVEGVLDRLLVRGVGQRDARAYLDRTYHPRVVIHEAPELPYGGDHVGPEGVLEHAAGYLATWDRFQEAEHHDLDASWLVDGDEAVASWQLKAADRAGRTWRFPALSHYRFADGLVVESRMYHFDLPGVLGFLERAG